MVFKTKGKKLKLKALELGATELLTREQLKNLLGGDNVGSGGAGSGGAGTCSTGPCSLYDPSTGTTYMGTCGVIIVQNTGICECITSYGAYQPTSGSSHCLIWF